uniref:SH2 domain-containing protein n=1 Tax=Strongyloides venezuelensis TaxID=75913 RepID=A0A0K0F0Q6_STRVS
METEHNHSPVSIFDESLIESYGISAEDKYDVTYFVDNFNGSTKFTYKKSDKRDPNDEKCFECVEFFNVPPDDFIKLGLVNFVINEIEKDEGNNKKENDIRGEDKKINNFFDKLSTIKEEKMFEVTENDISISSPKTFNNNNTESFKKIPKIPTITITDGENEMKKCNDKDETNSNDVSDCTDKYATIIADKICNDAFNLDGNFVSNDIKVNILNKYYDLEEIPLQIYNDDINGKKISETTDSGYLSKKSSTPDYSLPNVSEALTYYDYHSIISKNNIKTNQKSNGIDDSLEKVDQKQGDKNVLLEDENYNINNRKYNDSNELKYKFDESYAKAILKHHESFHTAKGSLSSLNSLSDEERIKTVITLKSEGFSDILNVNHCIDCILERTLQANPFYHAQPDRLSMRCSKCKPCNKHSQNEITYLTLNDNSDDSKHECDCKDICREVNCSMCSTKVPLCKNLEHEKCCTDKYSAPVPINQISNTEKGIKFLRSDSNEMIEMVNDSMINTTVDKERQHIPYFKPKKSWFKKLMTCNSCRSGKRKIYNQS